MRWDWWEMNVSKRCAIRMSLWDSLSMWLGASWVTAWLLSGWRINSQRVHLNIYHNLNYGLQFTEFQLFAGSGTGFLCPVCKTEQNYYLREIALLPWCTTCFIRGIRGPASAIDQETRQSMRRLLLSLPTKRMSLIWDIVLFFLFFLSFCYR
jgi:hypothetical protein